MNSARLHVGRLVEIRADRGYRSIADVDDIFAQIARLIPNLPAEGKAVIVTDWRRCGIMSKEASEYILPKITATNSLVIRSAAITSRGSPTTVMQFARIIRESQHQDRRIFFETEELVTWLDEVLVPAEQARLRAFLAYQEP